MNQPRVIIIDRTQGPVHGFTTVNAMVHDGDTGEYQIATRLVGTAGEINEILAQSATRMELRRATEAGRD